MATLPPERHPVLVVHANAVALGSLALQPLKSVARWSRQVFEAGDSIQELEFPLDHPPDFTRDAPRSLRIPLSEQVCSGFVRK
jgi:hypothetical protein